jgi:hypothetical protein
MIKYITLFKKSQVYLTFFVFSLLVFCNKKLRNAFCSLSKKDPLAVRLRQAQSNSELAKSFVIRLPLPRL